MTLVFLPGSRFLSKVHVCVEVTNTVMVCHTVLRAITILTQNKV